MNECNGDQAALARMLPLIFDTWKLRPWRGASRRIKMHLSEQNPAGRVGAHSDYIVRIPDLLLPLVRSNRIDLMIEAKMKERAVIRLKKKYCK